MTPSMENIQNIPLSELSEEQFKSFFDGFMEDDGIKEGSVVSGRVIAIQDDWVTVDINYKAEGVISAGEFRNADGEISVSIGDSVDVYLDSIENKDGVLSLSKEKADLMKAWEEISEAVERDETVTGTVIARVKGGLSVNIGVKAFLPGSQVDLRPVKNLEKLIGEKLEFKIIKFNKKRGNIVLSRRVLLENERASRREETVSQLREGAIVVGAVKNITDYGAFIDLGGIDGLLHITDMSYGRLQHPSEMFEVGQNVEVKVLKFDSEAQRVSLGYKQIRPDPWAEAEYKYPVGAIVRGKVVSIPDYGAFIELEDGIEGLVHISEMTWNKRIKHPSKIINAGDTIEAKVLGMDVENKRISLGMKQLESNPWDIVEQRFPVGSIIKGTVRNITDFGLFVGIEDGIDGLVHISDMSWGQRVKHPSERYQKGDEVEVRVLAIDKRQERFSLGIKQLTEDPWFTVHSRYFLGQIIEGPVVHQTDFGLFVEIEDGVEGLVHLSELNTEGDDWQERYQDGNVIRAEVIHIDSHERKISLSERSASERGGDELEGLIKNQNDAGARLGDVFGGLAEKLKVDAPEAAEDDSPVEAAADEQPAEPVEEAPVEAAADEAPAAGDVEEAAAEATADEAAEEEAQD